MQNFVKIRKLIIFGPKYLSLGIWVQTFRKPMSNLKSAPSNFVKIGKLILSGPKFPNLAFWARKFPKQITNLKLAHSKKKTCEILLRLENQYFFAQNAQIWAFELEI